MGRKHSDITFLLSFLLAFSASLGWFFSMQLERTEKELATQMEGEAAVEEAEPAEEDEERAIEKEEEPEEDEVAEETTEVEEADEDAEPVEVEEIEKEAEEPSQEVEEDAEPAEEEISAEEAEEAEPEEEEAEVEEPSEEKEIEEPPAIPEAPQPAEHEPQPVTSESSLNGLSAQTAFQVLTPLRASHSVDKIAELMQGLPIQNMELLAEEIVKDESGLLEDKHKMELISMLVAQHPENVQAQYALLSILARYTHIHQERSLLLDIAELGFANIIPVVLSWAQEFVAKQGHVPKEIKNLELDGVATAVRENLSKELGMLVDGGVKLQPQQATDLLWIVVEQKKDAGLIPYLAKLGANANAVKDKHTMLTQAAQNNNPAQVDQLAQAGADVNKMPSVETGTALQIASQNGFAKVENVLRKHGAKKFVRQAAPEAAG